MQFLIANYDDVSHPVELELTGLPPGWIVNDLPLGEFVMDPTSTLSLLPEVVIPGGAIPQAELILHVTAPNLGTIETAVVTIVPESTLPPCPGDINGDGVVDGGDLLVLLSNWGPCPGCSGDLNGDGVVNGADLLIILGAWGPCPPGTPDDSCADRCNSVAPAGCWCDEMCCIFDDCCADKEEACAECDPDFDPASCAGLCGEMAPDGCWCDELCAEFGDCCDDVCEECSDLAICQIGACCFFNPPCQTLTHAQCIGQGGTFLGGPCTPDPCTYPVSCGGFCGGQHPDGCWCDAQCCDFGDCCDDQVEVCGLCGLDETVYQYDSGETTNALGFTEGGVLGWLHRFAADGGGDEIVNVATTFGLAGAGPETAGVQPGDPVGYAVFTDSGEGPGELLWSGVSAVDAEAITTGQLQVLPLNPPVVVSGTFYVAVWVQHPAQTHPAPMDETLSMPEDVWLFGAIGGTFQDFDPAMPEAILPLVEIGVDGVWMLRANQAP